MVKKNHCNHFHSDQLQQKEIKDMFMYISSNSAKIINSFSKYPAMQCDFFISILKIG